MDWKRPYSILIKRVLTLLYVIGIFNTLFRRYCELPVACI